MDSRKNISEFESFKLTDYEMYLMKGKGNSHFFLDGIIFSDAVASDSHNVIRSLRPAEDPLHKESFTANPFSSLTRGFKNLFNKLRS